MLLGSISKDSADVSRAVVDFSQWLDQGETLSAVSALSIAVLTNAIWEPWQSPTLPPQPPPVVPDTDTLTSAAAPSILAGATQVSFEVANGTPGLSYICTYTASGSASGRIKEIDVQVNVRLPAAAGQTLGATFAAPVIATLSAGGTTQATAASLPAPTNIVTSVGGVRLSAFVAGGRQQVFNRSGASLTVFPPAGHQIETMGNNAPVTIALNSNATFTFNGSSSSPQWLVS